MASGPKYVVEYRRRRSGKTDYKRRFNLLKSQTPRLVIRKTEKHISAQLVKYFEDGDKILASAHSKELSKLGWKHSTSNICASYLVGVLVASKAKSSGVSDSIIDLGMMSLVKGGRIYATVKGAFDGGLKFPIDESVFPSEDRLAGKHIVSHNKKSEKINEDLLKIKDSLMKKK
ncbi:MAG: 50S ribosomal protein L18 [Methanobacteriota archaeon]